MLRYYRYCVLTGQSYIIKFACVSVRVFVRNRLPNQAYYDDETFSGDSIDPEEVRRLNFILKKHFLTVLLGQNRS